MNKKGGNEKDEIGLRGCGVVDLFIQYKDPDPALLAIYGSRLIYDINFFFTNK